MRIAIIIPCFNEAKIISYTLQKLASYLNTLRENNWLIICVDDGSSDLTSQNASEFIAKHRFENCEINLITLQSNVGKGGAIQAGLQSVHAELYGFMDADLSINFADALPRVIQTSLVSDVIIGRRIESSQYSFLRSFLSKLINNAVRFILGTSAHDHQCGFKFINNQAKIEALKVERMRFAFDTELLIRAQRSGSKISEIAVTWTHRKDTRVGLRDGFRFMLDIIAMSDLVGYRRFMCLLIVSVTLLVGLLFFWVPFYGFFFSDDFTWLWKGSLILHKMLPWYDVSLPHFISPVINLFYAASVAVVGLHAWVYFVIGLLVHAINSVLVGLLTREYTKSNASGFIAAPLFAVAGGAYEPIVWIGANMHSIVTLFILSACFMLARAVKQNGYTKILLLAGSLGFSLFAYGTKEISAVLIILLIITFIICIEDCKKMFDKSYYGFFVLSIGIWIAYFLLSIKLQSAVAPQIAGQVWSFHLAALLRLPIVFTHMIIDTSPYLNQLIAVLISAISVIAILALFRKYGKDHAVTSGVIWMFVSMLPTIFFIPEHWWSALPSRYTYLPRVGFVIAIASLLGALIQHERVARVAKPIVLALLIIAVIQFTQMMLIVTNTYSYVYATGAAIYESATKIKSEGVKSVIIYPERPFAENKAYMIGSLNLVGGVDVSHINFIDQTLGAQTNDVSDGSAILQWVPAARSYLLITHNKKIKINTRFSRW